MSRLDEIKARAEAATPGPWSTADDVPQLVDPRRNVLVAELLAALPESALSRSGADDLADTILAALDAMGADQ